MMCCGCPGAFEETLHYSSPAHGGWGVVRMGHLMPESYQLFVSPAACGRHGAVSACMQGRKNRVSYLYLSEDDIVSGGYEDLLLEAVDGLLEHLARAHRLPKVLMIFVSCIDDLLGTDHDALLSLLRERHPDLRFTFCHMNPTSMDTGVPPPVNIRNKLYGLLELQEARDNGINLIGSLVPLSPEGELFHLLPQMGVEPLRHITDYNTFDAFQQMARSQWNLVVHPQGEYAARQMAKRLGIPFLVSLTTYAPEEVTAAYQAISQALDRDCPETAGEEAESEASLARARDCLGGMPVVIDGEAVARPFAFARALLERGFHVRRMLVQKVIPSDRDSFDRVREQWPELELVQPQHHRSSCYRQDLLPDCLAIGYHSGYHTGSRHIVALDGQSGHWGYHGIREIARLMSEASRQESDLKALITAAGLVV